MESVELEINGRMITAHTDGSISWIHGTTGKLVNRFGSKNSQGYMRTGICGKGLLLHRIIAQAFLPDFLDFPEVDHIDGNPSNNDVSNLRMVTHGDNTRAHMSKIKGCSSQYRGVIWEKQRKRWKAQCGSHKANNYIGYFDTEVEAAMAYNAKATELGFLPEALNVIL